MARRFGLAFFATYALDGVVLTYLTLFLQQARGWSSSQIGFVVGLGFLVSMASPMVASALAERWGHQNRLLAGMFLAAALAMLSLCLTHTVWLAVLGVVAYTFFSEPAKTVVDTTFFHVRNTGGGVLAVPYQRLRVLGTVGYAVPAVIFFVVLSGTDPDYSIVPLVAALLSVSAAFVAIRLPVGRVSDVTPLSLFRTLLLATRSLFRGRLTLFVIGCTLVFSVLTAYATFFPIFAVTRAGVAPQWVGPIASLGLVSEFAFMLAFGPLERRFGGKAMAVAGALSMGLRMLIVVIWANPIGLCLAQLFHGPTVAALTVGAKVHVNDSAGPGQRQAVQGAAVLVMGGVGRVMGGWLFGPLNTWSPTGMFAIGALVCLVSAGLLWASLRPNEQSVAQFA